MSRGQTLFKTSKSLVGAPSYQSLRHYQKHASCKQLERFKSNNLLAIKQASWVLLAFFFCLCSVILVYFLNESYFCMK